MGMVAPQQRIASAYFVVFGKHGDVSRYAQERGVCRQWVYREAAWLQNLLTAREQHIQVLEQRIQELDQKLRESEERLAVAVVVDEDKQAEAASVAQANGVSLPIIWEILGVFIPGQQLSVATLGRRAKAAGEKSGQLLPIFDEVAGQAVRDAAADELYVNDPVRMMVEQESLCWLSGRKVDTVDGEGWAQEFRPFPNLEQLARDGGKALAKGIAIVNAERRAQGKPAIVDQGDHFHALCGSSVGLRRVELEAAKALAEAEKVQKRFEERQRTGIPAKSEGAAAREAWRRAEKAMDVWSKHAQLWEQVKAAMRLVTPEGELNTRQRGETLLGEILPQLPERDFAKTKRQLQKPEMFNYLDHVQQKIQQLPFPEEVKQAAVRQECLRRHPVLLKGEGKQAAVLRGILLVCGVVLAKTEAAGRQAQSAVRDIFRRAYRASSLVECINSAIRMHQCRHRKISQGLLDLKRLYWNCHTFRTGRRRDTTPYQRLGVPWPEGLRWWDVLKLTPEQLREKLSTGKTPP
jgi:hypothetical protein